MAHSYQQPLSPRHVDPPFPVIPQKIEPQTIHLGIDNPDRSTLEHDPLRGIDFDLEDRILHPLPEIPACPRDPPQAPDAASDDVATS